MANLYSLPDIIALLSTVETRIWEIDAVSMLDESRTGTLNYRAIHFVFKKIKQELHHLRDLEPAGNRGNELRGGSDGTELRTNGN